jgi:hypothetical protein
MIMVQYELVEENSDSCPIGTSTPTGLGVPMWLLAIIGVTMMVGIVYMGGDKKGVVK